MRDHSTLQRLVDYFLSFGAFPGESITQRGRRRIVVGYAWIGSTATIGPIVLDFINGMPWVGVLNSLIIVVAIPGLFLMRARPHLFAPITNTVMMIVFSVQLAVTALLGGLWASGLVILFGLIFVLAAAIALSPRATAWWFVAFMASIIYAALIPNWIEARYVIEDPTADAVLNIAVTASLTLAVVLYFVRQRDRFQQESDELLHNILPDEIATRLKTDTSMIADDFPQASVLFADVVGFTPMTATMTPPQLVGLLNQVFTKFDEFVEEIGLEKIKTIGDEYMVAAGVPTPRDDHAEAIAQLALRIRDYMASHQYDGKRLELRIGIHSGPVVAGIIGTHKFAYDLWGDTVNTASRMESGGIPGQIQVTPTTYDLLSGSGYRFEPRGTIDVKGKGQMNTWILKGKL